jgi:hypothetical protein
LDTVIVNPGITLTIQPGVMVRFKNDAELDTYSQPNNYAHIIAVGTITDSITFTSDS